MRNEQIKSLSNVLQNVAVGVFVFELYENNCRIVIANPAICEMMGIDADTAIGIKNEGIFFYTHPEDIALIQSVVEKLKVPDSRIDYEYRTLNKKTGKYLWLSAKGRSVAGQNGKVLAYISYYDITEQKKLRELQSTLEAEKSDPGKIRLSCEHES